jgi:hypothetical protein
MEASKYGDELAEKQIIDSMNEGIKEILDKDGAEGLLRHIANIAKE